MAKLLLLSLILIGQDDPVFRSSSSFIAVDVQVLAGLHAATGLKRDDFRIWDNNQPQSVASFGTENQELDVLLMIDVSQSTSAIQEAIKSSATAAMAQLLPGDRVGVVVFADEPFVATPLTVDRAAVAAAIARLPVGRGGTELNATTKSTAKYLRQKARFGARRAIVMMTDNKGYQGVDDQEVRRELWASNVVFNVLLFPANSSRGKADVRTFAKATGGEALALRGQGVSLEELFRRLRQRYFLLYAAPASKPGELHQIRVELSDDAKRRFPKARVNARSGYVAAGPP